MSADKLVFDLSQELEGSPNVFIKKDWLNILDNNNGIYTSNQSTIDTSQLSNSNKWISYREGYLVVPLLITATTDANTANFLPNQSANSADYAFGLKNWFGSVIHSMTLDMNGTTIVQQTGFINMWNSFKLMTTFSWGDVATQGAHIGFYPDDPTSWVNQTADSVDGRGICNNTNYSGTGFGNVVTAAFSNFRAGAGNIGFLKRQQYVNYDPAGVPSSSTYAAILTATGASTLWKSYIFNKVDGTASVRGVFQQAITAIVELKHIHSFFQSAPLLKGVFMKMILTLNNTSVSVGDAIATDILSLNSVTNAVGGVCPLMISSARANNGAAAIGITGDITNLRVVLSVGAVCLDSTAKSNTNVIDSPLARSIYLYVPAYTFNPIYEQAYLSSPVKTISYTDVYQYQVLNVTAASQVNSLISNGIANLKSVLVLPFYSAATNAVITGGGFLAPYSSPYDPAGCGPTSPLCLLTNFNVVVSGQNMIYNTQQYGFQEWRNQLYGYNAVNGGMIDGLTSGLIDQQGFEMEYCYHYVDVSRMLPVEESVPKSVQILGVNPTAKALDLFVFCEYGVSIQIDSLTGARV